MTLLHQFEEVGSHFSLLGSIIDANSPYLNKYLHKRIEKASTIHTFPFTAAMNAM